MSGFSTINLLPLAVEISWSKVLQKKYTLRACSSGKADKPPLNEGRIRY